MRLAMSPGDRHGIKESGQPKRATSFCQSGQERQPGFSDPARVGACPETECRTARLGSKRDHPAHSALRSA